MAITLGELAVEIIAAGEEAAAAALASLTGPGEAATASIAGLDAATAGLDAVLAGLSAQAAQVETELAGTAGAAAVSGEGFHAFDAAVAGTQDALATLAPTVAATRAALAEIAASGGAAGVGLTALVPGAEGAAFGVNALDVALARLDAALAGTAATIGAAESALASIGTEGAASGAGMEAAAAGATESAAAISTLAPVAAALAPELATLRAAIASTQAALGVTVPAAGEAGAALAEAGEMAAAGATGLNAASGAIARLDGALAVLTAAIEPTEAALTALMAAAAAAADTTAASADGLAAASAGLGTFDAAAASLAGTLVPLAVAVGEARAAIAGIGGTAAAATAGIGQTATAAAAAAPEVGALAGAAKVLDTALATTAPSAAAASAGLMELAGAAETVDGAIASLDAFMGEMASEAGVTTGAVDAMAAGLASLAPATDDVAYGMGLAGAAAAAAAAELDAAASAGTILTSALEALDTALVATEAYFAPLLASLAPLLGALAAFEGLKHSIADSADLEQSQQRLKLAVEDTGASWAQEGQQMAASIQHVVDTTTVGVTEATDALQRLVLFTGNATVAQENLEFAVNLSKASGKDLDTTTRALGAALEGNTMLLQRMFPALKGNADILGALRQETAGYAADELNTLHGQLDLVGKNLTEMMIAFGDALAQGDGFKSIVKGLSEALAEATSWIKENHAAFSLLGDVIMTVVEPAWAVMAGSIRIVTAVLSNLKPELLLLGEVFNLTFNGAAVAVGGVIAALGKMIEWAVEGAKVLAPFSEIAFEIAHNFDGVGQAAEKMGDDIALHGIQRLNDMNRELAEMAANKDKLDKPAAAPTGPANSNDHMLAAMQSQLALGKELIADQSTQAQGMAVLLGIQGEYDRVMASSAATSQQKAAATKIEHEAIDALITPLKEQLDVAKALIETDANRKEGIALATQVEEMASRAAAAHGANLKEVAAAMALKHDAEMALLEPMQQDLALGTDLVENARTEAQGQAVLNQAIAEATAVINSHHPSLTALAEAYKTVRDAQAALLKPMEDEISLGRDLMSQDDTRAMGLAKLTDAEGKALRAIADNANNPKLLAESWDDLRKAQEAVLDAASKDVSDGAILIASQATQAEGVERLTQAEEALTNQMRDKSLKIDDVAKAQRELDAIQLAMLIPLNQEVEAARELAAGNTISATTMRALAQAQADVEAKLATLTPGTAAYKAAQHDLAEAISSTIMALDTQAKTDERAAQNSATHQAALARLAQEEAVVKAMLQQTNLSLEDRIRLEKMLQGIEEARGDFSMAIAKSTSDSVKKAQETVAQDIHNFGKNTGMALNDALDAGIKAGFAGKNPMKAMENSMLSSMGNIFSSMGSAMIKQGLIMIGFEPALADPFTSGPAALAVGALLEALGATLGGIMQGDSSGSSASYSKNAPQTTNTTYFQSGAGNEAGGVAPAPNYPPVTIIGHNDPQAQRDLGRMLQNMASRGIPMGNS
jgi:hypothetical protein